ncbi:hypothetical protein DS2_04430 [Catenovulum agarivorans DS-2]|uniref:DUF6984 domain-containing protein n=1 Tax=Catenovulum agarivorans DS-2 TaxID=1328313 RepID=W7QHN3_9ALTE|nr:hypothetical protein [Catenovulum agarivorans]EWH11391.1 hypothetical protein DS2_04430 [Catenovulum agarivorans DS-2]
MRKLTPKEAEIINKLVTLAKLKIDTKNLLVRPLNDGGMGSLALGENYDKRMFGKQAAEFIFKDLDDTLISAALNLDLQGNLYELDLWKVDFSPTQVLQ